MLQKIESLNLRRTLTPAVVAAALGACAAEPVLLNSERIERRFGSYGIEVLASEAGLRRSSLYSLHGTQRICRTYALVRFTDTPDASYTHEHARVLAGNSLGAVFKANGWDIHKQTLHIGTMHVPADDHAVADLMQLSGDQTLALHVYQLLLVRAQRVYEYATIAEVHHPEYLLESDLLDIYPYDETDGLDVQTLREITALLQIASSG